MKCNIHFPPFKIGIIFYRTRLRNYENELLLHMNNLTRLKTLNCQRPEAAKRAALTDDMEIFYR